MWMLISLLLFSIALHNTFSVSGSATIIYMFIKCHGIIIDNISGQFISLFHTQGKWNY